MEIERDLMEIEGKTEQEKVPDALSKIAQANQLKETKILYKHFFLERKQGQKMTETDSAWALNLFARMRCDAEFSHLSTTKVIEKISDWTCMSTTTLRKLIDFEGKYEDHREGPWNMIKSIPDFYKELVQKEITLAMNNGGI